MAGAFSPRGLRSGNGRGGFSVPVFFISCHFFLRMPHYSYQVPPAEPQFCIARVTSIRQFLTFVPLSDPLRSTHYQTPSWWIPLGSEGDVLFSTLVPSGLLSLPTFTSGAVCLTQPWVVPRHSLALVVSRKGFARAVWESFASSDLPRSMRPHMAFLMRHSRSPLHFPSLQI